MLATFSRAGLLVSALLLAAQAGCSLGPARQPGVRACGQTIRTGKGEPIVKDLLTGGPPMKLSTKPPKESVLPPRAKMSKDPGIADFVRVSKSCSHGAIVVVTPPSKTRIVARIDADDGRPVIIALYPPKKVYVQAWVNGSYQGVLDPDLD